MNKSKTLYILVLLALIGVALIDHLSQSEEQNHITVGQPEDQKGFDLRFASLSK